jgi:hypothetical protein
MTAKDELLASQRAQIKTLYKSLLREIEDLKEEFDERFRLFQDQLPPEYLKMLIAANPFTEDRFMRLRKRILDSGNDVERALTGESEKYSVSFVFRN